MNLNDLNYISTFTLAQGQTFFRVQRAKTGKQTVRRGPLKLGPCGLLNGRFDLPGAPCAYIAETPETALFESVFRREATSVSVSSLRRLEALAVQLASPLALADLRPHAATWPVLQSLRLHETQELSAQLNAAGFGGVIYRSAQQYGHDCVVVFNPGATLFKSVWRTLLVDAQGRLSRHVALAAQTSKVPLVP